MAWERSKEAVELKNKLIQFESLVHFYNISDPGKNPYDLAVTKVRQLMDDMLMEHGSGVALDTVGLPRDITLLKQLEVLLAEFIVQSKALRREHRLLLGVHINGTVPSAQVSHLHNLPANYSLFDVLDRSDQFVGPKIQRLEAVASRYNVTSGALVAAKTSALSPNRQQEFFRDILPVGIQVAVDCINKIGAANYDKLRQKLYLLLFGFSTEQVADVAVFGQRVFEMLSGRSVGVIQWLQELLLLAINPEVVTQIIAHPLSLPRPLTAWLKIIDAQKDRAQILAVEKVRQTTFEAYSKAHVLELTKLSSADIALMASAFDRVKLWQGDGFDAYFRSFLEGSGRLRGQLIGFVEAFFGLRTLNTKGSRKKLKSIVIRLVNTFLEIEKIFRADDKKVKGYKKRVEREKLFKKLLQVQVDLHINRGAHCYFPTQTFLVENAGLKFAVSSHKNSAARTFESRMKVISTANGQVRLVAEDIPEEKVNAFFSAHSDMAAYRTNAVELFKSAKEEQKKQRYRFIIWEDIREVDAYIVAIAYLRWVLPPLFPIQDTDG